MADEEDQIETPDETNFTDPDFTPEPVVDPGAVRSVAPGSAAPEPPKKEAPKAKAKASEPEPEDDDSDEEEEEESEDEEEEGDEESEDEDDDSDEEEEEESEDEEEDYEKPADKKAAKKDAKAKADEAPFRERKEGEDPKLYEAKKQGHLRKQAENQLKAARLTLQERELEINRLSKENEEHKTNSKISTEARADYRQDKKYQALFGEIMDDVREDAELIGLSKYADERVFGPLVNDFIAARAKKGPDYDTAMKALRRDIVEKLGSFDTLYDEIDPDERAEFERKVLTSLKKSAPKVVDLSKMAGEIEEKAKKGISVLKIREYDANSKHVQARLGEIGKLSDEMIEKSPYSVASEVSRMVRDSPEEARRLARTLKEVEEVFLGPKPLTEEDIAKLEGNNVDVAKFEKDRQKKHLETRDKRMVQLAQGLMIYSRLPQLLERLAELEEKDEDEDSELDTIRKVGKKRQGKKSGKPEKKGGRRTAALDRMLGAGWQDD